jgi:hypothetical protein
VIHCVIDARPRQNEEEASTFKCQLLLHVPFLGHEATRDISEMMSVSDLSESMTVQSVSDSDVSFIFGIMTLEDSDRLKRRMA